MRILITNDDGINAPGLKILTKIARQLTDEDNVFTVAPSSERSGVGHCISYTSPMMISEIEQNRFSVDGFPADCVLAGIYHVFDGQKPDLVLSGVNRGNNSAENVLYSGTIGAALEGALQGIKSIALSQYYGPQNLNLENPFEASEMHGVQVISDILDSKSPASGGYKLFYNVNFPPTNAQDVCGVRYVKQGLRPNSFFSTKTHKSPSGRDFLFVEGGNQHADLPKDTDAKVNMDGYISITPMKADLTDYDTLNYLNKTHDR